VVIQPNLSSLGVSKGVPPSKVKTDTPSPILDGLCKSSEVSPGLYGPQSLTPTPTTEPLTQVEIFHSDHGLARNTLQASGQPSLEVGFHSTHLRSIQMGLDAMENLAPGLQARLDQLLHPDNDPQR